MKNNPEKHHRRSIRLREYDYSQPGAYYVTICTQNHECLFGNIVDGHMALNEFGNICIHRWLEIPMHYHNVSLDEFVIMPNHVHGIIIINHVSDCTVGAIHESPLQRISPQQRNSFPQHIPPFPKNDTNGTVDGFTIITDSIGGRFINRPDNTDENKKKRRIMTIPKIIGRFKMNTAKQINQLRQTPGIPVWQRNYYEHIIRDDHALYRIRRYIVNNPSNWQKDKNSI